MSAETQAEHIGGETQNGLVETSFVDFGAPVHTPLPSIADRDSAGRIAEASYE